MSALVPVRSRQGVVAHAVVDDEDFERVSAQAWSLRDGYAVAKVKDGEGGYYFVGMHRFVLGLMRGDPRQGDHENGDTLDNQRSNLRIVTGAQNAQNRRDRRGVSLHRGVYFDRTRKAKPWRAMGGQRGRRIHIGYFATEDEAAQAASAWRKVNMPYSVEAA